MTVSSREQQRQRQQDWEASHGPWHLERDGDDYVLNPEGSWGEGVHGPMIHNANCFTFNAETAATLPPLTWVEVKEWEAKRRAGEPIAFCGHCVAEDGEDYETWAARTLDAYRRADPVEAEALRARVAARMEARRAERGR